MNIYKLLVVTVLVAFFASCGNDSKSDNDLFSVTIKDHKKGYTASEVVDVEINNKKNKTIDSIVYFMDSERMVSSEENKETKISLKGQKLGIRAVRATIYSEGDTFEVKKDIIILSSIKPTLYTYKILETYPHDIEAYTQGLEFKNDTLYESTGQYKASSLRKTDYKTGAVLQKVTMADAYFGEGLTILNNKIYQLTWRENTGFIYNLSDLKKTGTFVYGKSKEGWGLANDGKMIYKSDGTEKIWTLNPNNLSEIDYIQLYTNTSKIPKVNELEWIDGKIYANIYEKDAIAIVDPTNGAVEGVIDLTGLKAKVTQHAELNVLNGIAYNGEKNTLYITGKNWDKMFKIEVVEQ
ncbi:glutaminyl-peptide cyclotransferase [Ulvibacter antarcticus]|uniref:Glutamine cyclotransferase n=1 Tax=Ulvibacter antarcticus TaxID=442714 RepID=A0A3L9YVW3_9FLAO|nr:glutaminyl-peptide cyclotransferase [Ulvibacter antarcticus]RMA58612.1 glutamine cyclotransferase [Ulvibacter antarcticus]